jgi:dTDP-glucose pyrophosphorylase
LKNKEYLLSFLDRAAIFIFNKKNMFRDEAEIAYRAELMLTQSLQEKTATFADHLNRVDSNASMKEATAVATVKKYGNRRSGSQQFYFTKLAIKMGKHGFIQHYGVNTIRSGGTRTRKNPRLITYSYRSHIMDMEGRPFVNAAIESSRVADFVTTEICRLRSEEIFANVRQILENRQSST